MRTLEGWSATKAFAAACAAAIRLGCTSVARMLPETSMARMMVWCWDGKVTTAAGRAIGDDHHGERDQEKQRLECDAGISGPCPSPPSPCSSWHT